MEGKHSGAEKASYLLPSSEAGKGFQYDLLFWGAKQKRSPGRRRADRPLKPQKSEGWKIQALQLYNF